MIWFLAHMTDKSSRQLLLHPLSSKSSNSKTQRKDETVQSSFVAPAFELATASQKPNDVPLILISRTHMHGHYILTFSVPTIFLLKPPRLTEGRDEGCHGKVRTLAIDPIDVPLGLELDTLVPDVPMASGEPSERSNVKVEVLHCGHHRDLTLSWWQWDPNAMKRLSMDTVRLSDGWRH